MCQLRTFIACTYSYVDRIVGWEQDLVDWMEAGKMHPYPGMLLGSGYEAGNSWQNRFPYYEMDFGFGKPVWSVRNA